MPPLDRRFRRSAPPRGCPRWPAPALVLAVLFVAPLFATGGVAVREPGSGRASPGETTPGDPGHAPAGSAALSPGDEARVLKELRAWESARRAAVDFAALPPGNRVRGPDPTDLVPLPGGGFAGILRGVDAVVVLDEDLVERARLDAPPSPTAVAIRDRTLFVSGELSNTIGVYRVEGALEVTGPERVAVPGLVAARAMVALDGDRVALADELTDRLVIARLTRDTGRLVARVDAERDAPRGTIRLERAGAWLLAVGLLEHAVWLWRLDGGGPGAAPAARIEHDGPLWCSSALATSDGLLVASGGVEDRPLDRSGGFFGNIDSFAFVDRVRRDGDAVLVERVAEVNLGEHGLLTPKWIAWDLRGGDTTLAATGYGGMRLAWIAWPFVAAPAPNLADPPAATRGGGAEPARAAPAVRTVGVPAGLAAGAFAPDGVALADPLLDAWVLVSGGGARRVRVPGEGDRRDPGSRLGEVLFHTGLMAPENASDGPRSRFSCETCHFEGYVDGRVHYTGRGAVHATTKPLAGLFNNRPHFSRALDPDLTGMVHNEFRVAGAGNGVSPWFPLDLDAHPGLADFTGLAGEVAPAELRRALASFLADFTHVESPYTRGRLRWTAREAEGAALFRARCEPCHEARLIADEPASRAPFDAWERLVFSPGGPVTWAAARYAKTGVVPYVHDEGARVPSLRRLIRKRPYFTDGSAPSIEAALDAARWGFGTFRHRPAAPDSGWVRLSPGERSALAAFLRTL